MLTFLWLCHEIYQNLNGRNCPQIESVKPIKITAQNKKEAVHFVNRTANTEGGMDEQT